jgi:hypothetical protein
LELCVAFDVLSGSKVDGLLVTESRGMTGISGHWFGDCVNRCAFRERPSFSSVGQRFSEEVEHRECGDEAGKNGVSACPSAFRIPFLFDRVNCPDDRDSQSENADLPNKQGEVIGIQSVSSVCKLCHEPNHDPVEKAKKSEQNSTEGL